MKHRGNQLPSEPIKITWEEIKTIFNDVIDFKKSREEANVWAEIRVLAHDYGLLIFEPPESQELIWEGLSLLHGCDIQCPLGDYLHPIDQFVEWRQELGL